MNYLLKSLLLFLPATCATPVFAQRSKLPKSSCDNPNIQRPKTRDQKGLWVERYSLGYVDKGILTKPDPDYPKEARDRKIQGTVLVTVYIDKTGKVEFACAHKGPVLLQQAAVDAAYKATFKVTSINGNPIRIIGVLTYKFSLK